MRKLFIAIVLFVLFGFVMPLSAQTTTIADARIGVADESPHAGTYHFVNVFQVRGQWIVPDVGYIDFAKNDYREFWIGGGYRFVFGEHFFVQEELLFVQATGPAAESARYLQPFTVVSYTPTAKIGMEAVVFPYIPLDRAGSRQWVVEHAKLEYTLTSAFKAGVGYGAYQFGDERWQHRPFVTTTFAPAGGRFGSLELWYQWLPDSKGQIQVRYEVVRTTKKK